MSSYNRVILMGNLTRDPEMRVTSSGVSVCKLGLAITEKYKDSEETLFIDAVCFNKTADTISQYFSKGRPIHIEGKLKFDTWDDKTSGAKRSKHEVVIDRFSFVGPKESGESVKQDPPTTNADTYAGKPAVRDETVTHDDIPPDQEPPF